MREICELAWRVCMCAYFSCASIMHLCVRACGILCISACMQANPCVEVEVMAGWGRGQDRTVRPKKSSFEFHVHQPNQGQKKQNLKIVKLVVVTGINCYCQNNVRPFPIIACDKIEYNSGLGGKNVCEGRAACSRIRTQYCSSWRQFGCRTSGAPLSSEMSGPKCWRQQ